MRISTKKTINGWYVLFTILLTILTAGTLTSSYIVMQWLEVIERQERIQSDRLEEILIELRKANEVKNAHN